MEKTTSKLMMAAVVFGFVLGAQIQAAGLMKPVNGNPSDVFIKSHKVSVIINNGFARTEVDQVFGNKSGRDLEAIYSFPIPEQASLSELSLWINGKEVIGEVLERQRARQVYQQETQKRVDPALAEKNGTSSFDVSVYPVVANGDTRLRLVYYQPIKIDSNIGRYVYPLIKGSSDEQANATFWSMDEAVKETFQFELILKSAFPVADVRVPGFEKAVIEKAAEGQDISGVWKVRIDGQQDQKLDKDIVFYYRLADDVPARVELIPYRKDNSSQGTFMVVVTPAADLKKNEEGCDWVFLVDKSGSMRGSHFTMETDGVSRCLGQLSEKDRVRIVCFNEDAQDITEGYVSAGQGAAEVVKKLEDQKPGGGTQIYRGLMAAYKGLDKNRTTAVILMTDGIGDISKEQYGDFLRLLEANDVRLFVFVLGNGGDLSLMDRVAKDSGGFAMTISSSDDVAGRIAQARMRITHEAMQKTQLKVEGVKTLDITPMDIGNLYYGQQLVVFGRYEKPGPVTLTLQSKIGGEAKNWTCNAVLPQVDTDNPELERLWALSVIDGYMQEIRDEGQTDAVRQKVVDMGVKYSLVTDYTSMLVLEEHRFKDFGIERLNQQRVSEERQAQQQRSTQPAKNYRVDTNPQPGGGTKPTFDNRPSPGIGTGSGPVGPLFVGLIVWMRRRMTR